MGFDTSDGKLLWQTEIPGTPESTAEPPKVADDTGFAAPTAVTDGRRVYAMFANGDIGAVDFDGKVAWSKSLGIPKNSYGHASSLAMWRDRLIVQFDQGAAKDKLSKLIAIDAATGDEVWSAARDVANSWPSPIVVEHGGVPQLVTCADPFVIAYNAVDGLELWRAGCLRQDVGPSPVVAGDVLIVANEYPHMTAIRLGGKGDITNSEDFILWTAEDNLPDTCSPLATSEYVHVLASYGYLTCFDTNSGKLFWEWESEDMYTSSPTLVGELIYLFGLESCHVLKPGKEEAQVVGQGSLGEECVTCPAFHDGRMFIRGKEHLFCIGKK
jgi:outer membrane protein assembly factor BamB